MGLVDGDVCVCVKMVVEFLLYWDWIGRERKGKLAIDILKCHVHEQGKQYEIHRANDEKKIMYDIMVKEINTRHQTQHRLSNNLPDTKIWWHIMSWCHNWISLRNLKN